VFVLDDTDLGLGASVWSNDPDRAQNIGKQLQAGTGSETPYYPHSATHQLVTSMD
jgi:acyl-CoA reductase-like NAD-dependent aldehyde dehydrogenase